MNSYYYDLQDPAIDKQFIDAAQADETLMILLAGNSQGDLQTLLDRVNAADAKAFGGVFSQLICGNNVHRHGAIISDIPSSYEPQIILEEANLTIDLDHLPVRDALNPNTTLIVFVDASCPHPDNFSQALFERYGDAVNYFGGCTGLLPNHGSRAPWSFSSRAPLTTEVAVVGFYESPSIITHRHGWHRVHGPLLATQVEDGTLQELNWQNAAQVYAAIVEQELGQKLLADEWKQLDSVGFPFGIAKQGEEDLVRFPTAMTDEGGLVFTGTIHANSSLHILRGGSDRLIDAARLAAVDAARAGFTHAGTKIIFDCNNRELHLGDNFRDEVAVISNELAALGDEPIIGALVRGEIASLGTNPIDTLNNSVAIGVFEQ